MTTSKVYNMAGFGFAYTSLTDELVDVELAAEGKVPEWIHGTLYRNGPALFEFGSQAFKHWFDGQAMVHAFRISDGRVVYSNKFLDTTNLRTHRAAGKIAMPEFGTDPCSTLFGRFRSLFRKGVEYQNANVSIQKMGGRLVALTETPLPMEFDISLKTIGPVRWKDDVEVGMVSCPHPHTLEDGSYLNYVTQFGRKTSYILYTVPAYESEGVSRRELARTSVEKASYMHSFGVTKSWVILAQFPWKLNVMKMLVGSMKKFLFAAQGNVLDAFEWKPELGTCFTLFNRQNGSIVEIKVPAFFAYHFINCYESEDKVVLDLMTYKEPNYSALTLEKLRAGVSAESFEEPQIRRYILDIKGGTHQMTVKHEGVCELPTIHYEQYNMQPYRYTYGIAGQHSLIKVNVDSGERKLWSAPDCSAGEPIFVSRPGATEEDDGAVLSVVFDARSRKSFLLVLDAASFQELARAGLPHHVPASLHGLFVPAKVT